MKHVRFEDEMWAEKNGYSAFEDRILFYKLQNNGHHSCVVSDAKYLHNDAKTSTQTLRTEPVYAAAYNHYVFWYRHIYQCTSNVLNKGWKTLHLALYTDAETLSESIDACRTLECRLKCCNDTRVSRCKEICKKY